MSCISIHAPRGGSDTRKESTACDTRDFNPRSPWGERPLQALAVAVIVAFQSTLPVGGATGDFTGLPSDPIISIHAPRGGSDHGRENTTPFADNFNPRSPWGERLVWKHWREFCGEFQSTLPVGGATLGGNRIPISVSISIHAPRGGSDTSCVFLWRTKSYFNPRSPWGERHQ